MERKTTKWYRDQLANIESGAKILSEVVKKYGRKYAYKEKQADGTYKERVSYFYIKTDTEFNWNHRLKEICLYPNGKLLVVVYWQGDSTDGDDSVEFNTLLGKTRYGDYVIPAEYYDADRYGVREERHSPLRIERWEVEGLIKQVEEYLSPKAIKLRKVNDARKEKSDKIYDFLHSHVSRKDDCYWNGRCAVQELLEKEPKLLDKSYDELQPIIKKVFDNNNKSDYYFRGGWFSGPKKPYNLTY